MEESAKKSPKRPARLRYARTNLPIKNINHDTYYGGGGGSRTPVREALPPEDYMLIPFQVFRRTSSERARRSAD